MPVIARFQGLVIEGSTDKFSHTILTHLFRPHCALDPPHSFCYASGLPSCSDEKIYANLVDFILSAIPKMYFQQAEHNPPHFHVMCGEYMGAFDIQTLGKH